MGACDFETANEGETMREAFGRAQEDARYEDGHGGYTGTIAEVGGFLDTGAPPDGVSFEELRNAVFDAEYADDNPTHTVLVVRDVANTRTGLMVKQRSYETRKGENPTIAIAVEHYGKRKWENMVGCLHDKWGPCVGVEIEAGKSYGFFGMASS
jgi:hypothetical protein